MDPGSAAPVDACSLYNTPAAGSESIHPEKLNKVAHPLREIYDLLRRNLWIVVSNDMR